jgi:hypothetical protein
VLLEYRITNAYMENLNQDVMELEESIRRITIKCYFIESGRNLYNVERLMTTTLMPFFILASGKWLTAGKVRFFNGAINSKIH